jgi:ParB family transcriptional regulator, chromosome partitioning protein
MNARTNTAATLEIAVPAQNLILVPLSQLRPSKRNVCKTVGASITELAASVARVGQRWLGLFGQIFRAD